MSRSRSIEIALVVAFGAALLGLVGGVRGTARDAAKLQPAAQPSSARVVGARSYRDMQTQPADDNAHLSAGWWEALAGARPDPLAAVAVAPDTARARATRAARRAYEGAPPTIPHSVDQLAVPSCLVCHGKGLSIAKLNAPPLSHTEHSSCVQCHVVGSSPVPGGDAAPYENQFAGLTESRPGSRAWLGAPPTIPHSTWMRERCQACHGVFATPGIRSSHPWRDSCTQCHVGSAVLDQRPDQVTAEATP